MFLGFSTGFGMRCFTLILMLFLSLGALAEASLSLAEVYSFDNSHIGAAGSPSPNYEAFKAELSRGKGAEANFQGLLKDGRPAAKIYAALGLYSLDKLRGVAALESLRDDSSPVRTMSGCMVDESTVGEVARELLANDGEAVGIYVPSAR